MINELTREELAAAVDKAIVAYEEHLLSAPQSLRKIRDAVKQDSFRVIKVRENATTETRLGDIFFVEYSPSRDVFYLYRFGDNRKFEFSGIHAVYALREDKT